MTMVTTREFSHYGGISSHFWLGYFGIQSENKSQQYKHRWQKKPTNQERNHFILVGLKPIFYFTLFVPLAWNYLFWKWGRPKNTSNFPLYKKFYPWSLTSVYIWLRAYQQIESTEDGSGPGQSKSRTHGLTSRIPLPEEDIPPMTDIHALSRALLSKMVPSPYPVAQWKVYSIKQTCTR